MKIWHFLCPQLQCRLFSAVEQFAVRSSLVVDCGTFARIVHIMHDGVHSKLQDVGEILQHDDIIHMSLRPLILLVVYTTLPLDSF